MGRAALGHAQPLTRGGASAPPFLYLEVYHMQRYQVWSAPWSTPCGPIPERLLFDGQEFDSKAAALRAWSDTCPGRNDRAVVLASIGATPSMADAIAAATPAANRSWLPQQPIACAVASIGWCLDSIACGGPLASNVTHAYPVAVLPAQYFDR